MKKIFLKSLLVLIGVLITSLTSPVRASQDVFNAWVKCDFNGSGKWTTDDGWQFNPTMGTGSLEDLGTLTSGNFTITYIKWKCKFEYWDTWPKKAYAYMWYKIDNGSDQHSSGQYYGISDQQEFYPYTGSITWNIASYTDASGTHTFTCGFYCHFHWDDEGYNNADLNNGGNNYKFTYKVAPPTVNSFSVTAENYVHGDGSEGNPYIIPYGGDLSLSISGSKHHTDGNSSAQYYNTSTTNDWSTTNTKTISNVRNSSKASVTVKMRYKHNTEDLAGAESSKTIWYKADANLKVDASTAGSSAGRGTVYPASVYVGNYYSQEITATPNNGYYFYNWTPSASVSISSSTSNPTDVTATETGTVTANFKSIWTIKGGDTDGTTDATNDAMGNWSTLNDMTYVAEGSYVWKVNLAANTNYYFKVYDQQNDLWYGCNNDPITSSMSDYTFYTGNSNGNSPISTAANGGGEYIFSWNASDHQLSITFPSDKEKAVLKKKSIVYFDITTGNGSGNYWHNAPFTARFWFKTLAGKDISSVDKASSTMLENWHYYATVPDNDYVGRVQMNRIDPSNSETIWNTASTINKALDRDDAYQNCLVYNHDNASPTISWGTYCPPISTATLSNNGTTVWGGDGGSSNPYLVPTSSSIFVTTNITQPLEDGNMTQMYQFKDNGSNHGDESSTSTHTFTASGTTGTKVPYTVTVRNNYNSTNGTSATSDAIYFEARTPYNIAYKPGAYGAEDAVTDVKLKGVSINLRGAIYTREGYTQTGWSATDGGVQSKALNIAYTTDEALELYPVWTAKTTTVTLDPNTASHGTGEDLVVTATYDNGTLATFVAATPDDGYDLIGYFYGENKIVNADGSLVKNTAYTSNDESPVWKSEVENLTLLAHYEEHTYSITIDKGDHGAANGSGSVVFDATSATISTAVSANAGYSLAGYYDGELKVLNTDGSFANTNVAGYITSGKWSKNEEDATLTAKFNTVTLTFNSGIYWNVAENWSPACVPTIEHEVIIPRTCRVTNKDAQAKRVKIDGYNDAGRLYIEDGGGLVVAEGITAKHTAEGEYNEATTDMDLWIRTSDLKNSGLICGNSSDDTEATYIFYSKVYRWESYYINQYVGIPYTTMSPYQWYGVYVFEYDDANDAWKNPDDGDLKPFTAYDIISKSSDETWTTFYTDGTLNLPGISGDGRLKTLNCGWRAASPASIDKIDGHQDYLFANSWTAPISIEHITSGDYSNLVSTIYIFNAGYIPAEGDEKILGDLSGTWSSISFEASSYMDHKVIPATQAFMVTAKAEGATLTLDYKKHVYDPALSDGINNDPLKAPRRTQSTDAPTRLKMTVQIDTVKADILYLFEREDFTSSFDDGWDGYKIMGENFAPQLYAINGESQLAIDAVPELDNTEIGFKAGTLASEYTFAFNYNDDEPLYLYDKDTQEFTQISNEATYTFTTNDTDEHARFIITRSNNPAVLTAIENSEVVIQAEKFFENGQLFIKRGERIYNATGELVK